MNSDTSFRSLAERIATLEATTDNFGKTLIDVADDVKILRSESSQWAGVRRTLGVLVTLITLSGAFIGYVTHYFWPLGVQERGH